MQTWPPSIGVKTKELNKAVKRNPKRFPKDFMFRLTRAEPVVLRFQSGTSKTKHGGKRYLPNAFSEQGVAMLSTVLHSERAVLANIAIMRAFVRFREMISAHKMLARKLAELERQVANHDEHIQSLFNAIRALMAGPDKPLPRIGFKTQE